MNFGGGPATTPPTPYTPGGQQGCFFGEPGDGSPRGYFVIEVDRDGKTA